MTTRIVVSLIVQDIVQDVVYIRCGISYQCFLTATFYSVKLTDAVFKSAVLFCSVGSIEFCFVLHSLFMLLLFYFLFVSVITAAVLLIFVLIFVCLYSCILVSCYNIFGDVIKA